MAKKTKHTTKVQQKEVAEKIQAIANEYHLSPSQLFRIVLKTFTPMNQTVFCIPEEKRLKCCLPDEMMVYILSIPDYKIYRACQLRDMVLEKFPDSGYSETRIYRTCYYLLNREKYIALQQKWNEEHHERRLEMAKKNNMRKARLYKEMMAERRKEKAND